MASAKERMSREMSEAQNLVDSMASKLEVARESAKRKVEQLQEEHRAEVLARSLGQKTPSCEGAHSCEIGQLAGGASESEEKTNP